MQLTQKESSLVKDLKSQEQLCIDKYTKYADTAKDGQLKNLFTTIANTEREHLSTLTQIENGNVPQMSSGGNTTPPTFTATYNSVSTPEKSADEYLCKDTLTMEKHVSSVYNTSIFEFCNKDLRDILNHIQKEEQEHGKQLFDYMSANSMYRVQ